MSRRPRRTSRLGIIAAVVAFDLLLSAGVWFVSPLLVPEWDGACSPGTTLVVFFGGENSHTRSRVKTAERALKECPDLTAFLVGGARPDRAYFGSEEMKSLLEEAGIQGRRLVTERRSMHSIGNIAEMLRLSEGESVGQLVVVSDQLHIIRILHHIRGMNGNDSLSVSGLISKPDADPLAFWWRPHYEIAAWLLSVLPRDAYDRLIAMFRG